MTNSGGAKRAKLNHPVIDSDGHFWEFMPLFEEYFTKIGGPGLYKQYEKETFGKPATKWNKVPSADRFETRAPQAAWWVAPGRTGDLATALLPKLLYERMPEFGIDFSIMYPTNSLTAQILNTGEVRRAACRAFNTMNAERFAEFSDKMTPAASIPMDTPEEAIDEIEYCVRKLGMKAIVMPSFVRRPIPAVQKKFPGAEDYAFWIDTFAIDSAYDYDKVWAKCVELKVNPTFHGGVQGLHTRASISNYVYNHIGGFGGGGEVICRSLFMGGVTRRFPTLKFAFLEGGVSWACSLYNDLYGHWKKRNREAVLGYDPANLDRAELTRLFTKYAEPSVLAKMADVEAMVPPRRLEAAGDLDEFAACKIERAEDIRDLFVEPFYFGCEGDDAINGWAYDSSKLPFGSTLNALYGSDIGHWDVPDMSDVAHEAYENVEDGVLTKDDFRHFTFIAPAKFWGTNPDFFKGTAIDETVRRALKEEAHA